MWAIKFDPKVVKVMTKWKRSNPILFKKLSTALQSISEDPRRGIGHPEPLIGGGNITYSRRISAKDRIIYRVYDNEVYVIAVEIEGHYVISD